jgi:tetratricopeptide (TPR) repeat protein
MRKRPHEMRGMKRTLFIGFSIIVAIVTVMPYLQTASFDFVNLDDWKYVKECSWLHQGLNVSTLLKCFTEFRDTGCWFPVTRFSYLMDVTIFGMQPSVMHLHNAVLHTINAVLVFYFFLIIAGKFQQGDATLRLVQTPSLFRIILMCAGTLFWSLHPLRVESVAWIASRKDLLSLMGEMIALIFWVRGMDSSSRRWTHGAIVFFVIAMMAKPTAITFAPLIVMLDVFLIGHVRWEKIKAVFYITIPLLIFSIYTQQVVRVGAEDPLMTVPFIGRLLNAIAAVGLYLIQTFWPAQLYVPCLPSWPQMPQFLGVGVVCCATIGGLLAWYAFQWYLYYRSSPNDGQYPQMNRFLLLSVFCLTAYVITLSPMLGIISFGYQAHADRFTYLPSIWVALFIALLLDEWFQLRSSAFLYGVIAMIVFICGIFSIITFHQIGYWRDTETLSLRALRFDPENVVANKNLGVHLFLKKKRLTESGVYLERAMLRQRDPLMFITGITILIANEDMKRASLMTKQFIKTIRKEENNGWGIHYRIAYAFESYCQGDWKQAEEHFLVVAEQSPLFAPVQYMLGLLAVKSGHKDSAEKHWSVARRDVMFRDWL